MRQVPLIRFAHTYGLTFLLLALAGGPAARAQAVTWLPAARLSMNAAEIALAGSNLAHIGGAGAVTANPAGIAGGMASEAQAAHVSPMPDTSLNAFALVFPKHRSGWGLSVQQLVAADLLRTDSSGAYVGTFDYQEGALGVAWAQLAGRSRLGASLRLLWQAAGDSRADGGELVLGMQRSFKPGWHIGVVMAQPWGRAYAHQGDAPRWLESLSGLSAGLSFVSTGFALHGAVVAGEVALGYELRPVPGLVLRAGAASRQGEADLCLGVGIDGGGVALDYAYVGGGADPLPQQLGLGHVVSVRFAF